MGRAPYYAKEKGWMLFQVFLHWPRKRHVTFNALEFVTLLELTAELLDKQ